MEERGVMGASSFRRIEKVLRWWSDCSRKSDGLPLFSLRGSNRGPALAAIELRASPNHAMASLITNIKPQIMTEAPSRVLYFVLSVKYRT